MLTQINTFWIGHNEFISLKSENILIIHSMLLTAKSILLYSITWLKFGNLIQLINSTYLYFKVFNWKKAKVLIKEVKKLEELHPLIRTRTERFNTVKAYLILFIFIQHRILLNTKREKREVKTYKPENLKDSVSHKPFTHPSALHTRYAN